MHEIVRADITDAAEIVELQKLAYQTEAILYNDRSIPPLTQTLEEIKKEFENQLFLKACDDDRIIGSVRAYAHDSTCYIGRLFVHPEYRRKGLGTRLMNAIEAEFPSAKRCELFTGSKSESNIHLYEALGYKQFRKQALSKRVELVFLEKYRR